MIKTILLAIVSGLLILAAFLVPLAISAGIVLALNVIPWLLYNHFLAPVFLWPHASFWTVFLVLWCVNIVRNLIFGK